MEHKNRQQQKNTPENFDEIYLEDEVAEYTEPSLYSRVADKVVHTLAEAFAVLLLLINKAMLNLIGFIWKLRLSIFISIAVSLYTYKYTYENTKDFYEVELELARHTLPNQASIKVPKKDVMQKIKFYAKKHDVEPLILEALVSVESNFNTKAYRHEPKFKSREACRGLAGVELKMCSASHGLTQVVYPLHVDTCNLSSPYSLYDADTSLDCGAKILAICRQRHPNSFYKMFGCYNGNASTYTPKIVAYIKRKFSA